MRVLHWCMLGVTILLLVCEVTISQLCHSQIILVDSFHTLFILMRMALTPPPTAGVTEPPLSSLEESPASPPLASSSTAVLPSTLPAESSIEPQTGTQTTTDGSTLPDPPPTPHPPALTCGLSHTKCRIQAVGPFISSLLLASLCLSYIMEIISSSLEPQPIQRPLLPVVVSAVSVLYKMLVFWLNWDQQQALQTESLEVNPRVLAEEETKAQAEPGRVLYDVSRVQSAVDDSLHNGAFVLCNPGTSSIPDADSQTPEPQAVVHLHAAAQQDSRDCEVAPRAADLSHSEDIAEISKDNTCVGHLESHNTSNTSPVCQSSHPTERPTSQWPLCLLSFLLVIQNLCTSLLALINSLVMLLIDPQCLHSSGACSLLVYLDPGLSLLAVVVLIATARPQVHRYGLLLLQASPPHICVSDLGQRIVSIPGVQAVHDLHVWQLTESLIVASVHVHCHAGFPAHRCADLMSDVTKVLQSVGVNCCTVQPEFASCSGSSVGGGGDPSPPPLLACSLACGKACAGNMCCSPLEVEPRRPLAPPAGQTKKEPQTLVIENPFLEENK
ncbi:zinc transporter 1 [Dicentrarchus labrax]|uniref:Cation efflux protein cytoplasmic domain-containing protein n=1 Tax=Dicentrarchus labrax TaxID=13489 RepID=A0A8C4DBU5_DICLA|nr:zinc transporter 1 [Dicentrarchus labrax]XP_051252863.1 zinc transporter 1 [Dicentrarchus labrax]